MEWQNGIIVPDSSEVEDVLHGLRRLVTESRRNLALVPNGTDGGDLWDVIDLHDLAEYDYDSAVMGRGNSPAEAVCDAWRKV
jgi:hypothetical protein